MVDENNSQILGTLSAIFALSLAFGACSNENGDSGSSAPAGGATGSTSGGASVGGAGAGGAGAGGAGAGGASAGGTATGGAGTGGILTSGGAPATGGAPGSGGELGTGGSQMEDCVDSGADETFSFFVTSWNGIHELSGSDDGFGGDLRYPDETTDGLQGADNICQELASRVCHGSRTWKAYLSTSAVNAKDRIGAGPWFDYHGEMVAADLPSLLASNGECGQYGARLASSLCGTMDELGILHDGNGDIDENGVGEDDDHDTMTATDEDGNYEGFSCEDWTSVTATDDKGIRMGHAWPARSGDSWSTVHAGHDCAAGTNFIQNGGGDKSTVGGGGGYGGFYCFALPLMN